MQYKVLSFPRAGTLWSITVSLKTIPLAVMKFMPLVVVYGTESARGPEEVRFLAAPESKM